MKLHFKLLVCLTLTLIASEASFAADSSCKNPSQLIKISKQTADLWQSDFNLFLFSARLCSNLQDGDLAGSCVFSNFSEDEQNPYLQMGIQDGDRIYGTENIRIQNDLSAVLKIFVAIFSGAEKCLKIERTDGTLSVVKYEIK